MQADAARIIGIFERRIWKDPSNCIYLLETIRRGWSVPWDLRRYFPAIDGNQSHSWGELLLILLSFLETADSEGDVAPHSHSRIYFRSRMFNQGTGPRCYWSLVHLIQNLDLATEHGGGFKGTFWEKWILEPCQCWNFLNFRIDLRTLSTLELFESQNLFNIKIKLIIKLNWIQNPFEFQKEGLFGS